MAASIDFAKKRAELLAEHAAAQGRRQAASLALMAGTGTVEALAVKRDTIKRIEELTFTHDGEPTIASSIA